MWIVSPDRLDYCDCRFAPTVMVDFSADAVAFEYLIQNPEALDDERVLAFLATVKRCDRQSFD